ncbi:hypothetical protein Hdeb2414_s0001g00000791 [Helianthus debilis subsp. tardiflorus]
MGKLKHGYTITWVPRLITRCTTIAYSADGTRLFSCWTSKERESRIVEWNESERVSVNDL